MDHAEQSTKEDAAAARLSKFIGEYLKKKPELEGVHYSDLFEQYLPVHDKPRRLLADWLPEYFIKTASGTWRLPDKEEAQQLAELREAGTLRRIKRFANALIEGVPVRDKDRPGSDVDLARLAAAVPPCRSVRTGQGDLRKGRLEFRQPERRAADRGRRRLPHLRSSVAAIEEANRAAPTPQEAERMMNSHRAEACPDEEPP